MTESLLVCFMFVFCLVILRLSNIHEQTMIHLIIVFA